MVVRAINFVVVPDGLEPALDTELPRPAAPYRISLSFAASRAAAENGTIYLAPANRFGYRISEQEAGARFLIALGFCENSIVCCPSSGQSYLDTKQNATQLKAFLENHDMWPLENVCLVATRIHLARAHKWFQALGFDITETAGTNYIPSSGDRFVPRLWYYKYPFLHRVYEKLAITRDSFRGL